jgi:hypothetical protein
MVALNRSFPDEFQQRIVARLEGGDHDLLLARARAFPLIDARSVE